MPFAGMLLNRGYREALAPYPRSRAWASWLFIAQWVQLAAVVVWLAVIFSDE
jgi:hypothetical protein